MKKYKVGRLFALKVVNLIIFSSVLLLNGQSDYSGWPLYIWHPAKQKNRDKPAKALIFIVTCFWNLRK